MFFFISKILLCLATPIVWVFGLLLFALFAKSSRKKKKFLLSAIIVFYVFSNPFLFNEAIGHWEIPPKNIPKNEKYEAAIVLGGFSSYDTDFDRIIFRGATDRLMQALELYKLKKVKKLAIIGGSGSILRQEIKEGLITEKYLLNIGIPKRDLLIESESKNTHENAINTAKLLDERNMSKKILLVTSASHMRRARACFQKAGIEVETYSTDRRSLSRSFVPDFLLIPSTQTLKNWDMLIKEITGFAVYKMLGYV